LPALQPRVPKTASWRLALLAKALERVALGLNKVELGLQLLRNPRRPLSFSNIPSRAQECRRSIGLTLERYGASLHDVPCAVGPNELVLEGSSLAAADVANEANESLAIFLCDEPTERLLEDVIEAFGSKECESRLVRGKDIAGGISDDEANRCRFNDPFQPALRRSRSRRCVRRRPSIGCVRNARAWCGGSVVVGGRPLEQLSNLRFHPIASLVPWVC
jgi:hypothetical protein